MKIIYEQVFSGPKKAKVLTEYGNFSYLEIKCHFFFIKSLGINFRNKLRPSKGL